MATLDSVPGRPRHRRVVEAPRPLQATIPVVPELAGNIDSRLLGALFAAASVLYLGIYALEAPVRFVLYNAGKDSLILLRDGLIVGPLALLIAAQAFQLRLHPAVVVFGLLIAFHGLVLMGTIGSGLGVGYGIKILINVLFGFFVASRLVVPGDRVLKWLAIIWCITIVGVCLDKFVLTFPWTGIKTIVGDLNVDVSRDWQIQDPLARRVAGFTRSSISVAAFFPVLTIILLGRTRKWLLRVVLATLTLGVVGLTTQKGAIIAFAPIAAVLCLPSRYHLRLLRLGCIFFIIASVALPFLVMNLRMSHGTGVFSTESVYLRIEYTWPLAWQWITHHSMLIFGVGLGGIGGPQRLFAPDNFNPADNVFLLIYAYFGVFSIIYLIIIGAVVLRRVTGSEERASTATAILAFVFGYGTVVSIIEDQSGALFLGAAFGVMWRETLPVMAATCWTPLARGVTAIGNGKRSAAAPAGGRVY